MSIKKLITGLALLMLLVSGCGPSAVLYVIPMVVSVAEELGPVAPVLYVNKAASVAGELVSEVEKGIHQRKKRKANRLFNEKIAANKRQAKDKAGASVQALSGGTYSQKSGNTTYGSGGTSGHTTFNSDGTNSIKSGNATFNSDGTMCQTMGNATFCN